MAGVLTATMDGQGVIDLYAAIAAGLEPAMTKALGTASEEVTEAMKANAPVGVGGDDSLRGSIGFTLDPLQMVSEIIPTADYGDAVETGSQPHYPPAGPDSALAAWAKLKGLNVYAVAANIAKYGTKANPYIAKTFDEMAPLVPTTFIAGISVFLEGLLP